MDRGVGGLTKTDAYCTVVHVVNRVEINNFKSQFLKQDPRVFVLKLN